MRLHLICALALVPSGRNDAAWNRFRGPGGAGIAACELPATLDSTRQRWRTEVPPGFSSPVLTTDAVFITAVDGTKLLTLCLDRETGAERWRAEAPTELERPSRGPNSPAAASPATDGENVYVFFESFGLVSYDGRGKERWRHPLGPFQNPYGMASSPILHGDTLLLQCDHDQGSFVVAVGKDDGEELWRKSRAGATHGFSTPIVYAPAEGEAQLIVSGSYRVTGHSIATGDELWRFGGLAWQAKSTPSVANGILYVHSWMADPSELGVRKVGETWQEALEAWDTDSNSALSKAETKDLGFDKLWFLVDMNEDGGLDEEEWGYVRARATAKNGLFAIRLGGEGDVSETHLAWRFRRSLPNIPSPLVYDGIVYVLKEGGILTALDKDDGEVLKAGRVTGAEDGYFASPVAANGRIVTASHAGNLALLEAGADWKVLSVHELGEETWATPALDSGQVIVRTREALYCFEETENG